MRYITPFNIVLIILLPLLLFLLVSYFTVFDNSFYQEKFLEYNVDKNIPDATQLHLKVVNFVQGKGTELPKQFNEREIQHLWDVRNIISKSKILLHAVLFSFILLLILSAYLLKSKNRFIKFLGSILFFGGLLTIIIAAFLFLFIKSNFSPTFEAFHMMLFKSGTYTFDPATEMIVNLYPEELFMDLGTRISILVVIAAAIMALVGAVSIFKNKKNK